MNRIGKEKIRAVGMLGVLAFYFASRHFSLHWATSRVLDPRRPKAAVVGG
jgi:hypothetical protein